MVITKTMRDIICDGSMQQIYVDMLRKCVDCVVYGGCWGMRVMECYFLSGINLGIQWIKTLQVFEWYVRCTVFVWCSKRFQLFLLLSTAFMLEVSIDGQKRGCSWMETLYRLPGTVNGCLWMETLYRLPGTVRGWGKLLASDPLQNTLDFFQCVMTDPGMQEV